MSLTSAVIKFAVPLPRIEDYNSYLFIGPHPDDIEIGAGATAAKLAANGKKVSFLICIDGRFGTSNSDLSPEQMIEVRKEESVKSALKLGVTDVHFLDLCDGGFYTEEELLEGIAKTVGEVCPDIVFAPDPDVSSECHRDHLNVGRAAKQIAVFAPYYNIMARYGAKSADVKAIAMYMTAKPNRYVNTAGFLEKQLDSVFNTHFSQFPEGCNDAKSISLYLKLRSFQHGIRAGSKSGEGFRVLGTTHMHCLPEAGR